MDLHRVALAIRGFSLPMTWIWYVIGALVCIVVGLVIHQVITQKQPPYSEGEGE